MAALPDPGRARRTPPARPRTVRGHRRARRHHHRVHAGRAAQHLSQVPGDAGGRGRADADAAGLRPAPVGQRPLAVRLLVARRRDRAGPEPTYWGGAAARRTPSRIRIIPEALTQAAEYETGNLSVVEIPVRRDPALGAWPIPSELQRRPGDPRSLHRDEHHPRAAPRRAGAPRAQPRRRRRDAAPHRRWPGRGVRAAGAIPPGIVGYDSTRAPYPLGHRRRAAAAGRGRLRPAASRSSSGATSAPSSPGWRSRCSRTWPPSASGWRSSSATRPASGPRCGTASADLYLGDWYADYPDPENFTYPLFHSSNKGPGGNYAFLADPALDAMIVARAHHARHAGEGAARPATIDARVFDLAPWIFLWFPVDVWADAARREGLADSRRSSPASAGPTAERIR